MLSRAMSVQFELDPLPRCVDGGPCTQHRDIECWCWKSHPSPLGSLNPGSASAICNHLDFATFSNPVPDSPALSDAGSNHCRAVLCRNLSKYHTPSQTSQSWLEVTSSNRRRGRGYYYLQTSSHHIRISMRRFLSTMASGARKFAPLKEGTAANTKLPRLKVSDPVFHAASHIYVCLTLL